MEGKSKALWHVILHSCDVLLSEDYFYLSEDRILAFEILGCHCVQAV